MIRRSRYCVVIACLLSVWGLGGCLTEGQADSTAAPLAPGSGGNSAPTIAGTPKKSVKVGESYTFAPSASDSDGDDLSFTVDNKPGWADFDSSNGELTGTPGMGDVGTYSNIAIRVSDGTTNTSLPQFSVTVTQIGTGSATLSWNPPQQNEDGSALTDLAGFRIYYGVSEGNYPNQVEIDNPGITTYVVDNLSPDTYYFVATAFNDNGIESNYSGVATKVVN